MQLLMPAEVCAPYKSAAQRARVASEAWGQANLYCSNCPSPVLRPAPANSEAVDFSCPECGSTFQLKSQSARFSRRIVDAAYAAMIRAILENRTPNLIALHYDSASWQVRNAILVPKFTFPLSAIEKRKPLGLAARRAGWVGCNILLDQIPPDGKIPLIEDGIIASIDSVRQRYASLRGLQNLSAESRGWTLDVLRVVRQLNSKQFRLADVYQYEAELRAVHPGNMHVRAKIRQQLQSLRDMGFIEFLGEGEYAVRK